MVKNLLYVSILVIFSAICAYIGNVDIAVAWAAIMTTIALYTLKKVIPVLNKQYEGHSNKVVLIVFGVSCVVIIPAFVYIVTPLAFGGIVGVSISAGIQFVLQTMTKYSNT